MWTSADVERWILEDPELEKKMERRLEAGDGKRKDRLLSRGTAG